jgi:hypothetical protein
MKGLNQAHVVVCKGPPGKSAMKIITILGCGRSGSTLIEGLIQQRYNVQSLGEICYLWERGFLNNERCGCGVAFRDCEYWSEVIRDGFGSVSEADARQYSAAFAQARGRLVDPQTTLGFLPPVPPMFAEVAERLYQSAYKIGGNRPLIDSSKITRFAATLHRAKIGEVSPLHIFRDACGNCFSLMTPKKRPQAAEGGRAQMDGSTTVFHAIARWKVTNWQASKFGDRLDAVQARVFYDAFCGSPETELAAIATRFALEAAPADGGDRSWHSVSGNPMRFESGSLKVGLDERWRVQMKPAHQKWVRALTSMQQSAMEVKNI